MRAPVRSRGGCFAVDLVGSEELHSQLHGLLVRPQGTQGSVSLFILTVSGPRWTVSWKETISKTVGLGWIHFICSVDTLRQDCTALG